MTLVSMSVPFMEALARRDIEAASAEMAADVPEWLADQLTHFLEFRLAQLAVDASIRGWLGRAMVVDTITGGREVIGSIGFHGPPDAEARLEVGYSVDPRFRRQGFAREAVNALFDWAYRNYGVSRFIASIAPDNEPSLRLASQFGFVQVGSQIDEIDGIELVFETTWPLPQRRSRADDDPRPLAD